MRKSPLDTRPERRPLRIFAFDPMLSRAGDHRVTVEVPYRPLDRTERSFRDDRLEVVDYDASTGRYFRAVDLNDEEIAMTQGLEPLEHDPQFHQQMVYAVASKVLENFDRALGRRFRFKGGDRLRLIPHAFQARNAYFDSELNAVLFGYFPADEDDPGPNLPGQLIFTCLSHDVVAHEVAHAALSRLHVYYNEPTNPQVPALHEAFADIVAMFQRLTFPEVVAPAIRESRGNLLDPNNRLLDIGAQFGRLPERVGHCGALPANRIRHCSRARASLTIWAGFSSRPCMKALSVNYVRRTRDLFRLATGGSGELPVGELHPDFINRLTQECVRTAQSVLSMCIRATDYLPPVDPTFSDFLRAMITADFELNRADDSGLRAAMIEAFRQRGIRPEAVGSLAVHSLLLEAEDTWSVSNLIDVGRNRQHVSSVLARVNWSVTTCPNLPRAKTTQREKARKPFRVDRAAEPGSGRPGRMTAEDVVRDIPVEDEPEEDLRYVGKELTDWAKDNRARLKLDPTLPVAVRGFHPVHRIAPAASC